MSSKKYRVYENDLKFKHMRDIDPENAIWDTEDVEKNFINGNFDTLEYRIEECIKNDHVFLDLSHLNLMSFPKIDNRLKLNKIKYLFLNDNNLTELCDLSSFVNLEVLDISKNNLSTINYMPDTLEELSCHNNSLEHIQHHHNIKRLDCSNNNLKSLSKYDKLIKLMCDSNSLSYVPSYPELKWLDCECNPLTKIEPMKNLTYLNCGNTTICGKMYGFPYLKHLICNNTMIDDIDQHMALVTLEISNTSVTKLPFIKTLKDLVYESSVNLLISSKYNISRSSRMKKDTYVEFTNL